MTDQELDELEARLPVIVETLASLNMDISLEAWNYISNNILSSADAIAELREKNAGLEGLASSIELVERARNICEWAEAPWMIENPVSTMSSYWRQPDYIFNPCDYTFFEPTDNYTKKTCLWMGNGFVMPEPRADHSLGEPDDRIHKAPPGPDRANFRSATPMGFARAVFEANHGRTNQ